MKRPTADRLALGIVSFALFLILVAESFGWWGIGDSFFLGLSMVPLFVFLWVVFTWLGFE